MSSSLYERDYARGVVYDELFLSGTGLWYEACLTETKSEKNNTFDKKFSQYKKDIKQMENIVKKSGEAFYKENQQFKRR